MKLVKIEKIGKYDFIIKQDKNGYYLLNGYKRNYKNTFIISKYESETLYSHLQDIDNTIKYLIADKIF